jgi:uridine monophosphate synthetase
MSLHPALPTADALAMALALAHAGLIQFGRFTHPDGTVWPALVRLRWLPSYPALLHDVTAALARALEGALADRVLSTQDAIPLCVALSLKIGLPMTYPYGEVRDYTAAFAIEGAYDIGHPTLLLTDVLEDAVHAQRLTGLARRVGLDVRDVLAVLDLGLGASAQLKASEYRVRSLFTLRDLLSPFVDAGVLTPAMSATVSRWLDGAEPNS